MCDVDVLAKHKETERLRDIFAVRAQNRRNFSQTVPPNEYPVVSTNDSKKSLLCRPAACVAGRSDDEKDVHANESMDWRDKWNEELVSGMACWDAARTSDLVSSGTSTTLRIFCWVFAGSLDSAVTSLRLKFGTARSFGFT